MLSRTNAAAFLSSILFLGLSAPDHLVAWDNTTAQVWAMKFCSAMDTQDPSVLKSMAQPLQSSFSTSTTDEKARLGLLYHSLARWDPNRGWALKSTQILEKVCSESLPDEAKGLLLPFWGSALSLQAREDGNPVSKLLLVNKAFGVLDDAVAKYGNQTFFPRFLRAQVDLGVPDFFHKQDQARDDLQDLLTWSGDHPGLVPNSVQATIHLLWGDVCKSRGQMDRAVAAWKRALSLDPTKKDAGKEAELRLDRYAD